MGDEDVSKGGGENKSAVQEFFKAISREIFCLDHFRMGDKL